MSVKEINLREELSKPLPPEAITQHPTKTYLSSIKAVYVTERFNTVFGIGKWTQKVRKEHVDFETGMVVVHVTFEVPELNIYYESFGGNDNGGSGSKNFDLGDAYKGATTDALTKIGSYLEVAIDVFKGKHDNKKNEVKKPWLNIYEKGTKNLTRDMNRVYSKMKTGEYKEISEIKQDFLINKNNESTIISWFEMLKKQKQ